MRFEDLRVHQDSNSQNGSSLENVRVHSLTFSFIPKLSYWLATLQALALVVSPRLGLQHVYCNTFIDLHHHCLGGDLVCRYIGR